MIKLTELKRIYNPKGDILHALKASDDCYSKFGEAYFTHVNKDEVKGWKKHTRMEMNLIVPVGDVTFYIYNEDSGKKESYRINKDNYARLTVPPGYWMAFEGHDINLNLILNIASIEHESTESINVDLNTFSLR